MNPRRAAWQMRMTHNFMQLKVMNFNFWKSRLLQLDVWLVLTCFLSFHVLSLHSWASSVIIHHLYPECAPFIGPWLYTEWKAVQYLAANKTGSFTSMNDNLEGRVGNFLFFFFFNLPLLESYHGRKSFVLSWRNH